MAVWCIASLALVQLVCRWQWFCIVSRQFFVHCGIACSSYVVCWFILALLQTMQEVETAAEADEGDEEGSGVEPIADGKGGGHGMLPTCRCRCHLQQPQHRVWEVEVQCTVAVELW